MPAVLGQAHITSSELQRQFLSMGPLFTAEPALLVLTVIVLVGLTSARNHHGTLKNKIDYAQILEGIWHALGPHSPVTGRERESRDLGLCVY